MGNIKAKIEKLFIYFPS